MVVGAELSVDRAVVHRSRDGARHNRASAVAYLGAEPQAGLGLDRAALGGALPLTIRPLSMAKISLSAPILP